MNINCVICSDLISQTEDIYFTKCGHVFHYHCLTQWIERSKSCPQCRRKVTEQCISRVYFNFASGEGIVEDATSLQAKLDNANFQLRQKETLLKEKDDKMKNLEGTLTYKDEVLKASEKKLVVKGTAINALKEQLEYVKVQNQETERLRAENEVLKTTVNLMNELQKVLNATASEVEAMLDGYTDVKHLASFVSMLKRALMAEEKKNKENRDKMLIMKSQLTETRSLVAALQASERQLEERLSSVTQRLKSHKTKRKAEDRSVSGDGDADAVPAPPKIRRSGESPEELDTSVNSNIFTAAAGANSTLNNLSMNSLVKKIEQADSPYLNLKQSSLSAAGLHRRHPPRAPHVKPSEVPMVNPIRSAVGLSSKSASFGSIKSASQQKNKYSIFSNGNKPLNRSADMFEDMDRESARLETSYDGLGGHSKPDVFPVPLKKSPVKSCVPRLTAKHRLKRPDAPKTFDIGKMLQQMSQNNRP